MNMMRFIGISMLLFFHIAGCSQSKTTSFGIGLNSVIYQNAYFATPELPTGSYLNLRFNRHELLGGTDIYSWFSQKRPIFGAQIGYRYHFLREHRRSNIFLDISSSYVQYQKNCSSPVPYYEPNYLPCSDGAVFRNKSNFTTIGLGTELFLCKRFSLYSIVAGGINLVQAKVFKDLGEYRSSDQNIYKPIASLRLGLSYNMFVRRKNACDSCPH